MSDYNYDSHHGYDGKDSKDNKCKVKGKTQTQFQDTNVDPTTISNAVVKVPVLLAETTLQIVVEADIPLDPPAVEIKRVLKNAVLTQCKLVPVAFGNTLGDGTRQVTRAKLFVQGYIRKDIEYATDRCEGKIRDRIANVPFSGFADLTDEDFITRPAFGVSEESKSQFINPKIGEKPRLDKYYFQNDVFYNEQPFCELVRADFYELDFSPEYTMLGDTFDKITEKVVLDLTLKVLQTRQVEIGDIGATDC
ncbi:CsxC family protein [Pontibacillus yanchengensis]|uniref:DUF7852 domain-containing protein n=1 Tax=Pontibacillus yanchengensis Y32 TaxID=1385514 RepID=A0A0A2TU96_9BACI|nr:hypothetical protein [Pontibacillus yanchengensis]KGP72815.1 hypothetical protein N782_10075 [Pontibacillus yanchengensis Y32]